MDDDDYKAEFGCLYPIRFLDDTEVKMYDENGEVVLCKCGKPATSGIMGKDTYITRCSKCAFGGKDV